MDDDLRRRSSLLGEIEDFATEEIENFERDLTLQRSPFGPTLSYDKRELLVFDPLGREVLDLSEQASHSTEIVIHRSQLPRAGVYFYRLSTGNLSQTKMMIAQ